VEAEPGAAARVAAELAETGVSVMGGQSRRVRRAVRTSEERERLRKGLALSLDNPHPETEEVEREGWREWFSWAAEGDDALVVRPGEKVSWVKGRGWVRG
jgi:hypothetical protein